MDKLKQILLFIKRLLKKYISPSFVVLFCASFILWYVLKLGDSYVTEYDIQVEIEGEVIEVPCVVEAVGTDLLKFKQYTRQPVRIPLRDLEFTIEYRTENGKTEKFYIISPHSMRSALSVRMSEAKDITVSVIPPLPAPVKD